MASLRLLDKLEKLITFETNARESNIDSKLVYDYYQLSSRFRELIKDSAEKFTRFWNLYKNGDPNMRKLLLLNDNLDTISTEVVSIFDKL